VHLREKLWSITIFCTGRDKEEEELERACVSVCFQSCRMSLYIVAWYRKKTTITLNKGVKRGRKLGIWRE